jgi:hypothetical protein
VTLINSSGYEPVVAFADYVIVSGNATGDIIEMVGVPANYVPIDVTVDTQALGTTMTADVGWLSGTYLDTGARTMTADFMTGKTFQTAGIYRNDVAGSQRQAPATNHRSIGIKFTSVSTPTAGNTVRLTVTYRPQNEGV